MIFARVDVELRDHPRARRAGAAMCTWTYGLLYSRRHELDGFVPSDALRGAWVAESEARAHAATLVACGLWAAVDGGWEIVNYAAKNETKSAIAERREAEREKKTRWRRKRSTDASTVLSTDASTSVSPVDKPSLPAPSLSREEDQSQSQSQSQGGTVVSLVDTTHRTKSKGLKKPRGKTLMTASWAPREEELARIRAAGLDVAAVVNDFRDYWLSVGKPMADWDATLRTNVSRIQTTPHLADRYAASLLDPPPRSQATEPEPEERGPLPTEEQRAENRRRFAAIFASGCGGKFL